MKKCFKCEYLKSHRSCMTEHYDRTYLSTWRDEDVCENKTSRYCGYLVEDIDEEGCNVWREKE